MYSTSIGWPDQDPIDDLEEKLGPAQVGIYRKFRFCRLLNTGDAKDIIIVPGKTMPVGVAIGRTDVNAKHILREQRTDVIFSLTPVGDGGQVNYANNVTIGGDQAIFYWTIRSDFIDIAIKVRTIGWVALGIVDPGAAGMKNCDIVVGYQDSIGTSFVRDQYVNGYNVPVNDDELTPVGTSDIIRGTYVKYADGFATLAFTRKLNSTDKWDRNITLPLTFFSIAWSSSNNPSVSHSPKERALFNVNLFQGSGSVSSTADLK